jgi:hypothetical protein
MSFTTVYSPSFEALNVMGLSVILGQKVAARWCGQWWWWCCCVACLSEAPLKKSSFAEFRSSGFRFEVSKFRPQFPFYSTHGDLLLVLPSHLRGQTVTLPMVLSKNEQKSSVFRTKPNTARRIDKKSEVIQHRLSDASLLLDGSQH